MKFIRKNLFLILALVLINTVPFYKLNGINTSLAVEIRNILIGTSFTLGFCILIFAFCYLLEQTKLTKLSTIIKIGFLLISSLLFIIDATCWKLYNHPLGSGIIEIILSSNFNESKEYLETYVSANLILKLVFQFLMILGGAGIFTYLFRHRTLIFYKWISLISLGVCLGSVTWYSLVKFEPQKYLSYAITTKAPLNLMEAMHNMQVYRDNFRSNKPEVQILKETEALPLFVFILGESTSKHHMSMYGYNLNTTPLLNQRLARGELIKFNDVISPHGATSFVLEKLLSFFNSDLDETQYKLDGSDQNSIKEHIITKNWSHYHTLFEVLKKSKYTTHWLSNQEPNGLFGNIGKYYAKQCNEHRFIKFDKGWYNYGLYDEALIELFKELKFSSHDFVLLHLMGAHARYQFRLPPHWGGVSIKPEDEMGKNKRIKQERANYDNVIRYNDWIIDQIISLLENKNAILIYVPDHGEDVFDIEDQSGHDDLHYNPYFLEIPMLVWASSEFKKTHGDLYSRIEAAKDQPFMTDNLIHGIVDILGIYPKEYDETLNLFSDRYKANRIRRWHNTIYKRSYSSKELNHD